MTDSSSHIIIFSVSEPENIPADKRDKINEILEKANKEANKVLDKNPNL